MGVGIHDKECLRHLVRPGSLVVAESAHLPLAEAGRAMRINGQQFFRVIARSATNPAQGNLHALSFRHGVLGEQRVNGDVAGDEGKAIGQLEAALAEGALLPQSGGTQRRFVDQLQRQTRLNALARLVGPTANQVPSAQPQVFRHQQPQAHQVAGDLVRQELPHAALQAGRIARFGAGPFLGALRLDFPISDRPALIEFFFEGRTLR